MPDAAGLSVLWSAVSSALRAADHAFKQATLHAHLTRNLMGIRRYEPISELCRFPQTGTFSRVRPQLAPGLGPIFVATAIRRVGLAQRTVRAMTGSSVIHLIVVDEPDYAFG